MSRSFKKHPCWGDDASNGVHSSVHYFKNYANRMVRRPWRWDLPSGSAYKRVMNTWNIRDYSSVMYTKQQVMDAIEEAKREYEGNLHDHKRKRIRRFWDSEGRPTEYQVQATKDREFNWSRKYMLRYYYYAK